MVDRDPRNHQQNGQETSSQTGQSPRESQDPPKQVSRAERRSLIARLWGNLDRHALAERLGVSPITVSHDLTALRSQGADLQSRIGRKPDPEVSALREEVRSHVQGGTNPRDIASRMGIEPEIVYRYTKDVRNEGREPRDITEGNRNPDVVERRSRERILLSAGFAPREVRRLLGVPHAVLTNDIQRFFREEGLDLRGRPGRPPKEVTVTEEQQAARAQALEELGISPDEAAERLNGPDTPPTQKSTKEEDTPRAHRTVNELSNIGTTVTVRVDGNQISAFEQNAEPEPASLVFGAGAPETEAPSTVSRSEPVSSVVFVDKTGGVIEFPHEFDGEGYDDMGEERSL